MEEEAMKSVQTRRLSVQRGNLAGHDCWHSILFYVLRGLGALMVAAGHLRSEMFPGLRAITDAPVWFKVFAFATGFGHHAVMIFFAMSGWLVGGALLDKIGQPNVIANYAIDRVSRIFTVLIPTFAVTLMLGVAGGILRPVGIDVSPVNEFSLATFAGNLAGLQRIAVPDFAGNYALWTLGDQTWYYILFALIVLAFTARGGAARMASGCAGLLLLALVPKIVLLYFSIWLLGTAFSRVRIGSGKAGRFSLLVLLIAASIYIRLAGHLYEYDLTTLGMDAAFVLIFLLFMSTLQVNPAPRSKLAPPLARYGKFLASFSFSLYALHVPMIVFLKHLVASNFGLRQLSPSEPWHIAVYIAMLGIIMIGSYLSYWLFESRTYRIRNLAKTLLPQHHAKAQANVTMEYERR
jgi:peptidoglycan/LPS O-acetylase OafA/YrhL